MQLEYGSKHNKKIKNQLQYLILKHLFQHYPENEPIEESRLAYATPEINVRV